MGLAGTGVGGGSTQGNNSAGWTAPLAFQFNNVFPFVLSCWFRIPGTFPSSTFCSLCNGVNGAGGSAGISLFSFNSGGAGLFADIANDSAGTAEPTFTWTGADTKWHHFAIRLENVSVQQLYLDGVPVGSSNAATASALTLNTIQVGFAPNGMNDPVFETGTATAEVVAFWPGTESISDIQMLAQGANPLKAISKGTLAAYFPLRGNLQAYHPGRSIGLSQFASPGDAVWTDHPPVEPVPVRRPLIKAAAAPPSTSVPAGSFVVVSYV